MMESPTVKQRNVILTFLLLVVLLAGCGRPGPTAIPTSGPLVSPTPAAAGPTAVALEPTRPATATAQPPMATAPPTPRPTDTPQATDTPDPEQADLLQAMDAIGAEMETLRELEATQPITRDLMPRDELGDYLEAEFNREYPPEEIEADTRAMAAFDFVPEDFDLRRALLDVYGEQILGFYDDEADALYIISDTGLDLEARITLAHEYTHGLQDEHYDLETFIDSDRLTDDEVLARQALVEGDATVAMTEYLIAHLSELTPEDIESLQDTGGQDALNSAPPIIRETLAFPYLYGEQFVSVLREQGWEAVDAAYADPPASTEQIMHPDKYAAGEEPIPVSLPPLTDTLGAGWSLADAERLGEFQMILYLSQQIEAEQAEQAASGWGGDAFAVYVNGDDEVLVLLTAWDSAEDRAQFVEAYQGYAEAKYDQTGEADGDVLTWDTAGQAATLAWADTTALVIVGSDRATVDVVAALVSPQ